jgi:MscS family membrane protein
MKRTADKLVPEHFWGALLVSGIFLSLILSVPTAYGKDTTEAASLDPLRPADTSSPRDTLHSFLNNTQRFIEEARQDSRNEQFYRAYRRASQTLDFNNVPEGDTWFVRNRSIALLHELLARIKLPADKEIPGDAEVADGTITEWTIPDTSITISKIDKGPRAGEFLFTSDTIQKLEGLYRQARELPYQPGATPGIYEDLVNVDTTVQGQERELRTRLKSVDTYSPRSTLEGFLDSVNRAYELVAETNAGLQANPPAMTKEEARKAEKTAMNYLQRASDTLDLSQVPKALREDIGIETVLLLKEVFDRMLLPPLDAVPNAHMIAETRKETGTLPSQTPRAIRCNMPTAKIEIVEVMEGDRQGQFLFGSTTVKTIADVYKKIKDLPYRRERFGGTELEYASPGLSPGFFENYVSASGYLVPRAHFIGRLVDSLPEWFKARLGGQMIWQWTGLLFGILITLALIYTLFHYVKRLAKGVESPLQDWLNLLASVVVLTIVVTMGTLMDANLNFTGDLQAILKTGFSSIVFVLGAWVVFGLFKVMAETVIATPRMRGKSSEAALLRIGARVVGFLAAIWIVIDGIRTLGADLIPLLAGLGIGGLAVALAAQSTIANFIGGLILLGNKPVQVGDFCRYGEDPSSEWLRIGTIEEINWLSTRIRGIDRTVTTIPNAEFANMHIVNFTKRDQRLMRATLALRYETTSEQLRYILMKTRELLLGHPMVTPDPARVRFLGYNDYSKDVEIFCYLRCREQSEFLAIQEDVLLRIEEIIKDAGSGFAFPSQTAYLARDSGLDEKRKEQAETEVGHRRFTGKLPFPEFDGEERELLEDILDYPPKGSPGYEPRS